MINSLSPRRPGRRLCLVACLAALALSGCVRVDLTATINSDDTLDGELTAAVRDDAIDAVGPEQARQFVAAATDDFPGEYRVADYHEDDFSGRTVYFDRLSLSDFSTPETDADDDSRLRIVHENGRYDLDGHWDLRGTPQLDLPGLEPGAVDSAQFRITITFPGPVIDHNGHKSGNTVTWNLRMGADNLLHAQAKEPISGKLALIVLAVCVGLLILVMIALYVQLRRFSLNRRH